MPEFAKEAASPSIEPVDAEQFDASQIEDSVYRLLVQGVSDYAIYMLSPSGVVSSWNAGAERFKGYKAGEIIGRHFSEFYTPEDRARGVPDRALQIAIDAGKYESEGWRVRKDGTLFWAYVVIDPIRSPDGGLAGFAKITRDLTERRAAEELLKASREQFRLLVQGVTDYAIYMLSPDGHINSWNLGAQRIKGYSAKEIIGSHFSRFYTEEDRMTGEPARALATASREGRYEKEGRRVRKDGTTFWANVVIDAVRSDAGDLIGFAKVTRDITAQRDAMHELQLARESLFQAQKMEAVGQLTGGVAHDFNNLLMAISGSLSLLQKRIPKNPKTDHLIENALEGVRRGSALTQRMLAFARRQDLAIGPVDVPSLVRGMSDLLERSLGPSVELNFNFPSETISALTDSNQLELAILNLVVNARDAIEHGGTITIGARKSSSSTANFGAGKSEECVCISVQDNGQGMDQETLRRAGEPFFTTKGVGKGTGLGLAMVHGVAQQSGGHLQLTSVKGVGTTAEIWLPIATSSSVPVITPEERGVVRDVRSLVVLVVDDDALVLSSTVMMLEDLGHTVIPAGSAMEAFAVFENNKQIDLLITDHAMPVMTGAELADIVMKRNPNLPIVMATGYAELPPDSEYSFTVLSKPFTQDDLLRSIFSALNVDVGKR
jgi:PAS domain S-box-containing protein